jgi:hypothetical protein
MYGLKLYITLEDMNNYIRTKVDSKYKNSTFIPIKAEVNENDLSIDLTLVEANSLDSRDGRRYKLELSLQRDQGNGIKLRPINEVYNPCSECAHEDWDMPQCQDCNATNNFKYFEGWENNND